ncbi:MAG: F0F1 ATP synthase subunit C [Deltaproteobacteria bacterium]|nr:MAG: F0F1 ATP synthase subunit C [Deltaproteobacteria bacterium]
MTKIIKWTPAAVATAALLVATPAFASEADASGWATFGFGLALGLAVLGGTLAQGFAAANAFQSIARNPAAAGSLNAPFYVGLALIESLVIFAWVMVFLKVA